MMFYLLPGLRRCHRHDPEPFRGRLEMPQVESDRTVSPPVYRGLSCGLQRKRNRIGSATAAIPSNTAFVSRIDNPAAERCSGRVNTASYSIVNGTDASAHAAASMREFRVHELAKYIEWWQDLVIHDEPIFQDGYLTIQDKPGYGIELNPDVAKAHLAPGESWCGGSEFA